MSVPEPVLRRATGKVGHNPGRWRWWYTAICDYRIANPGCTSIEIAQHLGKNPNTISAITNTDLYREYEAQRMAAWRAECDTVLRNKLLNVTSKALDVMAMQLEKKRDQVPLEIAREITATGLDRLGFAPKQSPQVVVNNNMGNQVLIPSSVSASTLEEARMALRAVEANRMRMPRLGPSVGSGAELSDGQVELEAGPPPTDEGDGVQKGAELEGGSADDSSSTNS